MSDRSLAGLLAVIAVVWLVPSPVAGQGAAPDTSSAPRTPWGDPDLQGIWANDVSTPLERPSRFAGKDVLTEEELSQLTVERQQSREDRDRRDQAPGTVTDVGRAYNAFWFPVPGNPISRTSLIRGSAGWENPTRDTAGAGAICRLVGLERTDGKLRLAVGAAGGCGGRLRGRSGRPWYSGRRSGGPTALRALYHERPA